MDEEEQRRRLHQGGKRCFDIRFLFRFQRRIVRASGSNVPRSDFCSVSWRHPKEAHLLRLRQGGENVADVSGNGAAFPTSSKLKDETTMVPPRRGLFPSSCEWTLWKKMMPVTVIDGLPCLIGQAIRHGRQLQWKFGRKRELSRKCLFCVYNV